MTSSPVVVGAGSLTVADVASAARTTVEVVVADSAMETVAAAHVAMLATADRRPVYGTTTGVGANRSVAVAPADRDAQGLRLLRSHCAATGPVEPADITRATMVVRLNQLLAGASGIDPAVVVALADAVHARRQPVLHRYGSIGTGDLSALAELGLTLAGERPWADGDVPGVPFGAGDALALMSSNALTIAGAALAAADLGRLMQAATVVGALTFLALRGSAEALASEVHVARPHPGQLVAAAELRELIGPASGPAARVQDPFGVRTLPQVHGVAIGALDRLHAVLAVELNAGAENPMIGAGDVRHHGNFLTAELAGALDALRGALVALGALSVARLSSLHEPGLTGLPAFLASSPAGSSGLMMLEYVAHDALAELRALAQPVVTGGAVLSRGAEEHASFSTQAARRAAEMVEPLAVVLACELIAAVRALRMAPERLGPSPAGRAFAAAVGVLDADTADRPLDADLAAARRVVAELGDR